MAERDRSTVRIELAIHIDAGLSADGDDVGGKCLVQLDDVDVADAQAGAPRSRNIGQM
jgi:hypothetical protein